MQEESSNSEKCLSETKEQLLDQFIAAKNGDPDALDATRKFLEVAKHRADVIELFGGDVAKVAEQTLIARAAGDNHLAAEAMRCKMADVRHMLAGPTPTPIERLLAERAAICWFDCNMADGIVAGHLHDMTAAQANVYQRRQDRAHRRFLQALKTLATVRKMALPALQVNVAEQQVNIAA